MKKVDASAIQKVLDLISTGRSTLSACAEVGIPRTTFLRNVPADNYARAREASADRQFEEMEDLETQCRAGDIPPEVFRVVMDSRKWRLARMKPRLYGDKSSVDVNANVNILTKEQRDAAFRGAQLSVDDLK